MQAHLTNNKETQGHDDCVNQGNSCVGVRGVGRADWVRPQFLPYITAARVLKILY